MLTDGLWVLGVGFNGLVVYRSRSGVFSGWVGVFFWTLVHPWLLFQLLTYIAVVEEERARNYH